MNYVEKVYIMVIFSSCIWNGIISGYLDDWKLFMVFLVVEDVILRGSVWIGLRFKNY